MKKKVQVKKRFYVWIILLVLIVLILIFKGCFGGSSKKSIYPGDITPPEDFVTEGADRNSVVLLSLLNISDEDIRFTIYNLKRANCGVLKTINKDKSGDFYNIFDQDDNAYKLYLDDAVPQLLLDKDDNVIFDVTDKKTEN